MSLTQSVRCWHFNSWLTVVHRPGDDPLQFDGWESWQTAAMQICVAWAWLRSVLSLTAVGKMRYRSAEGNDTEPLIFLSLRLLLVLIVLSILLVLVTGAEMDLNRDTDGDGLRDHVNDYDDDNDGVLDIHDDDDDGDGVLDAHDEDWHGDL